MRVISGSARGRRLKELPGLDTRPTTDKVKESVFNILQFEIEGRRVLDLFGGTGALALEALSRGAADAVLCDSSPDAAAIIAKNIEKTHMGDRCRLLRADYAVACRSLGSGRFDLVFLDPPYAKRLVCPALRALLAADALEEGALIVCESEEADIFENDPTLRERFAVRKISRYGAAHVTVLRMSDKTEE